MKKESLSREVCRGFCHYYKPLQKEDLACVGFVVAERLFKGGLPVSSPELPIAADDAVAIAMPGDEVKEMLRKQLCIVCPFYEDGCDFIDFYRKAPSDTKTAHPMPCGGFLFLGLLLEKQIIAMKDINQVI